MKTQRCDETSQSLDATLNMRASFLALESSRSLSDVRVLSAGEDAARERSCDKQVSSNTIQLKIFHPPEWLGFSSTALARVICLSAREEEEKWNSQLQ
jgi:hypothetical protein